MYLYLTVPLADWCLKRSFKYILVEPLPYYIDRLLYWLTVPKGYQIHWNFHSNSKLQFYRHSFSESINSWLIATYNMFILHIVLFLKLVVDFNYSPDLIPYPLPSYFVRNLFCCYSDFVHIWDFCDFLYYAHPNLISLTLAMTNLCCVTLQNGNYF